MTGLADHLRIFPNAGHAIARQIKHNMQGHGAYLLGQTSPSALWYYFPVALTIKLALPLLLLFGAVLLLSPRSLANRLLAVAAALLLFSFNCRVQIGTRLVLPLVVFLVIGLTAALADAWQRLEASWRRRGLALAGAVALFWLPIAPARAWPQGLQYVNELWGGPREGYRHVGGSDYDWGQGVPELRRWAAGRPLVVLYYGTDPAVRAPDWRHLDPAAPVKDLSAQGVRQALQGRPLAVSIALLYGPPTPFARLNDLLALLRQRQPVDRTSCFFFYDFAGPE